MTFNESPVGRVLLRAGSLLVVAMLAACARPSAPRNVPLQLYVMASCPFAKEMLQGLLPVLAGLRDDVTLEVTYIGRLLEGSPTSMYGQAELQRAKNALCALELRGKSGWQRYVACELRGGDRSACATESAVPGEQLAACADGSQGEALLRASYQRAERDGVAASPTLRIGGKGYEGGRASVALARAVCATPALAGHAYCADVPEPVAVDVTIIGDARCKDASCQSDAFMRFVRASLPAARVRTLDYGDAEAQRLFTKTRARNLPVAIFGDALRQEADLYDKLAPLLSPVADGMGLVLPLGTKWDPSRPI